MRRIKMIWDFRGPGAEHTAKHHEIHLKGYAQTEQLPNTITGHTQLSDLYAIAFLVVDESHMKVVRDALKPHRGQLYTQN